MIYPEISKQLLAMAQEDQKVRLSETSTEFEIEETDKKNSKKLKQIIKEVGWPTISKVGEKASNCAWIIVQHSDKDIEFQKLCLNLMHNSIKDINKSNIAYLTDRILVAERKPQLYGTQFDDKGDYLQLRPVEDVTNLNKRRKDFELNPIEEYQKEMAEAFGGVEIRI